MKAKAFVLCDAELDYAQQMAESVLAEADDELMEKFLEELELTDEEKDMIFYKNAEKLLELE